MPLQWLRGAGSCASVHRAHRLVSPPLAGGCNWRLDGAAAATGLVARVHSLPHHGEVIIWIRRLGAVLVGTAFAVSIAAVLVLQAAHSTVARPGFFADQLKKADAYEFVIEDLLTAVLEDARRLDASEFGGEFEGNPLASSGLTTEQIAGAVRRALSPEDIEVLTAPAVARLGEYVAGERDEITLTADADAHLQAVVRELTELMLKSGAYGRLLERELTPIFADWVDEEFPTSGDESGWATFLRGSGGDAGGSLTRVFTRVVTPEWMAGQVERALDELTAYVLARSDGFELRIELDDAQAGEAAEEIADIIAEADAYDVAYATAVEPAAEAHLDAITDLPYGIVLTRTEVLASLRDAASPTWVERQGARLAGHVGAYVTGQTDSFAVAFDVVPLKGAAAGALTATASDSLRDMLRSLPECSTAAESATARAALRRELPACIPPGVTVDDVAGEVASVLASSIDESILARVPDTVQYTEQDLRDSLEEDDGPDALAALDDIRELFTDGWTYTDADLRAELSDDTDLLGLIEDVRSLLSEGYVAKTADDSREGVGEGLGATGEWTDRARRGRWIGGLVAGVLLVAVAFLGGTSWRGRIAWAAAVLLVSAGVIALVSGPLYQAVSGSVLDALREGLAPDPGSKFSLTSEVLTNKLLDVIEMVADDFVGDIVRNSLILAVVAAVPLVAVLVWDRIVPSAGRGQS